MAPHTQDKQVEVPSAEPPRTEAGSALWLRRRLAFALAGLSVLVVVGGLVYYRWEAGQIQAAKYQEIAAIASSKVASLDRWRREREFDAKRLAWSTEFAELLSRAAPGPGRPDPRSEARERLKLERATGGYADAYLLRPNGELLESARGEPGPVAREVLDAIRRAADAGAPVLGELHRDHHNLITLETVMPVRGPTGRTIGFVALSSDAADFLFPNIQTWPTPSQTAETLIVRRDGNDVLFLNDLRHKPGAALALRQPLSIDNRPAAMAVRGHAGVFFGTDYRDREVLADLRAIPGTSWFMVTKVDTDEVLAEVRVRALAIALAVVAIIVILIGAAAYMYRTRQSRERAEATAAIRRSEALLKEAQRVASLGHYELDIATGNWTCSDALEEVFGIDATYVHDVNGWGAMLHPEDRDEMVAYFQNHVVGGGHTFDKEYRIVRVRDGEVRWVHGLGDLRRDDMGRVTHMFGTIQDVTKRKELEEDLRQRNSEMTRFVYTVSHDLKSPIVTIQTFLGFLDRDRKQGDESRVQKDIGYIRRAADRMSELLSDLLELSRVGRVNNPPSDVSLQHLVRQALDMVAGRVAKIHAQVVVTDEPVTLHGDRPRLLELFENLIDNAVKFMGDQSAPLIEIGVESRAHEVVLYVRDNGSGIDPRHVSRLFGLFEKLHPGSEGTGIGLALVKRIVEVHGGRIWVHSDGPGQGTTFRFTIPGTTRAAEGEQC